MKKALIIGWLTATFSTLTWANCTTHTIMSNGRTVTCTTCCYGSNCTTSCF